jgi:hypothetical protein
MVEFFRADLAGQTLTSDQEVMCAIRAKPDILPGASFGTGPVEWQSITALLTVCLWAVLKTVIFNK